MPIKESELVFDADEVQVRYSEDINLVDTALPGWTITDALGTPTILTSTVSPSDRLVIFLDRALVPDVILTIANGAPVTDLASGLPTCLGTFEAGPA